MSSDPLQRVPLQSIGNFRCMDPESRRHLTGSAMTALRSVTVLPLSEDGREGGERLGVFLVRRTVHPMWTSPANAREQLQFNRRQTEGEEIGSHELPYARGAMSRDASQKRLCWSTSNRTLVRDYHVGERNRTRQRRSRPTSRHLVARPRRMSEAIGA